MILKGKLITSIPIGMHTQCAFRLDGNHNLSKYEGKEVEIKLSSPTKKRSLDSNAYLWVLCTKLAEVLHSSKDEIYEDFIQKYAPYYEDEDEKPITITVASHVDMSKIEGHWKYLRESENGKFKAYLMLKGSSQFDNREMKHFLDRVIEECEDQDIDVMTPDEIAKMNALWGKKDVK